MGQAVIYARQSDLTGGARGEDDGALPLDAQINACRAHAAKLGLIVLQAYQEQFSGLSDQRPQYLRMLADLKANVRSHKKGDPARITHVIVYKWSRLSRDPNTVVPLVGYFRKQGIEIEPVADNKVGAKPMDELMLYAIATFNRIQVSDSIEFSTNARKTLLDNGKLVCAGKARYGYRYDKQARTRVIDEENAAVVRRIFEWFLEGHAAHKVMTLLLQAGIPSPSGNPRWGLKTIRDIIKDPSYKGAPMRALKTERTPEDEGGGYHPCGTRKARPAEGREIGVGTPAIVTSATWDRANEMVKGRHRASVRADDDWLTGRVWCSSCGVRLAKFKHHRGQYSYWRCPRWQNSKECDNKLGHALDKHVRNEACRELVAFLNDKRVQEAKLKEMRDELADPGWQEEHDRHVSEIGKLKAKIAKLLAKFGDDPEMEELLADQIRAVREQVVAREELVASLAGKVAQTRHAAETVERVGWVLLHWPEKLLKSPIAPLLFAQFALEDKRLVAEAVGLRVEVGRPGASGITVVVKIFDYESTRAYVASHCQEPSGGRSRERPANL